MLRAEALEARELLATVPGEFIVYKLADGDIYRIAAQANAQPEDLSVELNALSTGTEDANVNISPNGQWLAIDTDRFGIASANSGAGLAIVSADLKQGAAVVSGGQFVYPEGLTAISSDGNLLVYSSGLGQHVRDLWALTRATGGAWSAPRLLTANSPYQYNTEPSLSADGTKLLFDGGPESDKTGSVAICEVGTNGQGFRTVITKASAPSFTDFSGRVNGAHFRADGSVIFEAGSSKTGDQIWKLPNGATIPSQIAPTANDEVCPEALPGGRTVSLWLGRVGNPQGAHELTLRDADGKYLFTLQPGLDIADIGMGAGGTGTISQVDTTTTLAASVNAPVVGQSVTFTATISVVSPGTGTPTGAVRFMNGSSLLGTSNLKPDNGIMRATLVTSSLAVGAHSITAVYLGDLTDKGSTSAALSTTVGQATTRTTVSASTTGPVHSQALTFTATVSVVSPGAGKPAGTVKFKEGATVLGTGVLKLVNGVSRATFTTTMLTAAKHTITAEYVGGLNNMGSTSSPLSLTVGKAGTTTKIKASANPVAVHHSVTFTATVTVVGPATGGLAGVVNFKDGSKVLGTGKVKTTNGITTALFTTSSLGLGKHLITAVYVGGTNNKTSSSGTLTLTVHA